MRWIIKRFRCIIHYSLFTKTLICNFFKPFANGAVGMVKMALNKLSEEGIIDLDEDKKAAMVSNLLVVLCSEENAQPVLNTGTLHQ